MSIIVADQPKRRRSASKTKYQYKRVADGIFRHTGTGWLHERPTIGGNRTWKSLETKNLKFGKERFRKRRSAEDRGENPYAEKQDTSGMQNTVGQQVVVDTKSCSEKRNVVVEPGKTIAAALVGDALRRYDQDDCPDRNRRKRPDLMLAAEKAYVRALLPFWDKVSPDDITIALCDKYHDKTVKNVNRGEGDRTVDLQLNTLRNALRWA